ncbi:ATP-binding cassette domain-containing protein [Rhodobacterales bacterium HKCCE3408]|nr:ATP-binding cassette domain-containing protein [Rhodobacterales bacterium HKCCE3408]
MTDVTLKDLTLRYPGAEAAAVADLSLRIASGQITALLGPSGGGKTTILKLIAGLLRPDAGDIAFDGQSVLPLAPEARGAVMVFQSQLLFPTMSVADNVGFGLRMRGRPKPEIDRRVTEMLDLVQLPGFGPRRPAELSGGQQSRVALARALVTEPRVLLLDEPLAGLDAHLREEMRDLIAALQRSTGVTTLVVTHDQEDAAALGQAVALMLDGKIVQHGPPEALYGEPATAAVARFFGNPNAVPGRAAGGVFHSPLGPLDLPRDWPDGPGLLTIRPEAITLGQGGGNTVEMEVATTAYLGTHTRLTLHRDGVTLIAHLPPDAARGVEKGGRVTVGLPSRALWLLPDGPA